MVQKHLSCPSLRVAQSFVREPKNVAVLGCLLAITHFQAALNLGFFGLDWLFPDEEQQEGALLCFPHIIPALAGGRNRNQGCSAAPRMSHGSSLGVFPTNIAQTKQTKQLVAGASLRASEMEVSSGLVAREWLQLGLGQGH